MTISSARNSSIKAQSKSNSFTNGQPDGFDCEYLVLAGGSGGGGGRIGTALYGTENYNGGGGGAGGYHTNVEGDLSGEDTATENPTKVYLGYDYYVQVGAGGAAAVGGEAAGGRGTESKFDLIVMEEGGVGQSRGGGNTSGGSGGGRGGGIYGGSGTDNNFDGQGFSGGWSDQGGPNNYTFGGGGGVSAQGGNTGGSTRTGTAFGGDGIVSTMLTDTEATTHSIGETDSGNFYIGAGGGAGNGNPGGLGGGGNGGSYQNGTGQSAVANTGSGGGGAAGGSSPTNSGAGGSGVVILRYPSEYTIEVDAGITSHTTFTNASGKSVTIFKAGADFVRWS